MPQIFNKRQSSRISYRVPEFCISRYGSVPTNKYLKILTVVTFSILLGLIIISLFQ